jgi:hypothetical protein
MSQYIEAHILGWHGYVGNRVGLNFIEMPDEVVLKKEVNSTLEIS